MKEHKVFCIGFHKTGTTSLAVALKKLNYKVTGPNGVEDRQISKNALPMAFGLVEQYDAFQDNPWPVIYRELDKKYPESKFVLMLRDPDSWIKSQVNHFGRSKTPMRQWIYGKGCPEGNEQIYLDRFNRHNEEVVEHFQARPKDLLIMNLEKGGGWEDLCRFLGEEVPSVPFPHANKAQNRANNKLGFVDKLVRLITHNKSKQKDV